MQIRFFKKKTLKNFWIKVFLGLVFIFTINNSNVLGSTTHPPEVATEVEEDACSFSPTIPSLTSHDKISTTSKLLPGDPPVAGPDTILVFQGSSNSGNVLTNDFDPDGDPVTLSTVLTQQPSNGIATINADGSFTYSPFIYFTGTDEFKYQICDAEEEIMTNTHSATTGLPMNISFFGTPTIYSTITVPAGGEISDVNIPSLVINHQLVNDLRATLVSPSGTQINLFDQFACGPQNLELGFDDESALEYSEIPCPPVDGDIYQPLFSLSAFDGEIAQGDWVLVIQDLAFWSGGSLQSWELEITALGVNPDAMCTEGTVTALVSSSSTEICNNQIDDDEDGFIDGFDSDCPCDDDNFLTLCEPECNYIPPPSPGFDIELEWRGNDSVNTFTPVIAGDLDNDPTSVEIVALKRITSEYYTDALMVIDGATGETKYTFPSRSIHILNKGLAIADVDKDGLGEIYYVVGNNDIFHNRRIACYEYNPEATNSGGTGTGTFELQWLSNERVTCGLGNADVDNADNFAVNLADFNGDGISEIYVGNEIYSALNGVRLAIGGTNNIGNNIYNFSLHEHYHANPVAVDALPNSACTNCQGLELVAGNQVYSVDVATGVMTVERELDSAPGHQDGPVSIVDYDLDGDVDAVITTNDAAGSYVYIWDLQTDTMIGNVHTVANDNVDNIFYRSISNATVADFDGDGKPEIGVCSNSIFQVVEDHETDIGGTGGVAWSLETTDRSGMTGATAFDFNADGVTEVVYRDESNLRIISGETGENLSTIPCGSRTGGEYPIVLDIDNDKETEIVCTCGSVDYSRNGFMSAFKSKNYPWVPSRDLWNQYAYFITNVNDDLDIPPYQQPHHKVGDPALGTTGRLNSFLKQVGPYNNEGELVFPSSDIQSNILSIGSTECVLGDSFEVIIMFYNYGEINFPDSISFALYEGNPTISGTLIGAYFIPTPIAPGDSAMVSIMVASSNLTLPSMLYVIGNDDGSLPIPFDLEDDFPSTSIGECDYFNNMDSVLYDGCEISAPVLSVPADLTVSCENIPPEDPDAATATDNCSVGMIINFSSSATEDNCPNIITRTWTTTDDCGNIGTASQIITVIDTIAPVLSNVPPSVTVDCSEMPDTINPTVIDCDLTADLTVEDIYLPNGNFANLDEATVPAAGKVWDIDVTGFADLEASDFSSFELSFSSNKGKGRIEFVLVNPSGQGIYLVGEHCTGGDCESNGASQTWTPTFHGCGSGYSQWNNDDPIAQGTGNFTPHGGTPSDPVPGVIEYVDCFEDFTGEMNGQWKLYGRKNQTVNGNVKFLSYDFSIANSCMDQGIVLRKWTAIDDCGNASSASQRITLIDTIPPIFVDAPTDTTVNCNNIPPLPEDLLLDDCDNAESFLLDEVLTTGCTYTITRRWVAIDPCENTDTLTQVITVIDTLPPVFQSPPSDFTLACGDDVPVALVLTAIDDCSGAVSVDFEEISGDDCSEFIIRKWKAEDACGNIDSVVQIITLVDTIAPVISNMPEDIEIPCTECLNSFLNGDFETPIHPNGNEVGQLAGGEPDNWVYWHKDSLAGWHTASNDNIIELHASGTNGLISASGNQHAELNANQDSDFYQEFCTIPTTTIQISFAHAKRNKSNNTSDDIMGVFIGPDLNNLTQVYTATASEFATWTYHNIIYAVPLGQTSTVFVFRAVQGSPNNVLEGNCIDDIKIATLFNPSLIPSVSDNCDDDVVFEISDTTINNECTDQFQLIRTWTATDDCGNTSSSSQIVTVGDFVAPDFTSMVPSDTVINCGDDIPPAVVLESIDNCSGAVDVVFNEEETEGCTYTITRTWMATDNCGNDTIGVQVITVQDINDPIFSNIPNDTIVECGAVIPNAPPVTAFDDCSQSVTPIVFSEDTTGICPMIITRKWVAEDNCGNRDSVFQTITIEDTTLPVFTGVPPNITVNCDAIPDTANVIVSDDCISDLDIEFTEERTSGCTYFISRVWRSVDSCGNEVIANQLITVIDTIRPILTGVPNDITVDCESIPDTAIVTVSDNCTDDIEIIFTENISSGCPYTITRTWSATDSCNNTITGTQIITVEDTTDPVLVGVPSNITVECTSIPDTAIVTANDNCTADIEVEFTESISAGCPYTITRTWSATDSCNNTITASQIIEVIDTVKPILENVPSNVTVECPIVPGAALVTASDNCTQNVTIEFTEEIGTGCSYTITRKWVATDNCLNKDSVIQVITVEDTVDPMLAGVPASVTVDCGSIPDAAIVTSVDACAGVLEVDFVEEISAGCPYTITRTWSATDFCNNTVTATQVITVEDNTNPTFTNVPSNVTVSCDAIPDTAIVTANDDCSLSVSLEFTEVTTTGCPYTITRKWIATDDCLNKDSVVQVISVIDNEFPVLIGVPQATTVTCDAIPDAAIVTASDNCSSGMTVEFNENRTYGCPYFITRVWTVRDDCGNETIGSQLITVQDTESPELVGVPVNITVDCESIPDTAIVTVSDNCTDDIEIIFTENISSGCPYTITRTWSATDSCNNTITGTQIITVEDTTDPVLVGVPSNITVECTSIPDTAIVTANDNCTADIEVEFTESISAGCPYTITRTWSATDSCNNTITASQIIEVIDTVKPILENVPSNVTVECPTVPGAALVTASDNCTQNVTIEFTEEIGTGCSYTITRKWVATDNCLNKDSVIQVITVEDNIDPILAGVPASVTVDCGAIPDAAIVTSVDACAGVLEVDFAEEISTGCPYTITRTWSATDSCNNTVTATQVITVEDNTNPTFTNVPSNVTVSCDAIPDTANVLANDDCSLSVSLEFTEVTTTGCPYTITRKWIAIDDCLNKDSVVQVISVIDNEFPVLIGVPQATTVTCDAISDAAIVTASDNCSSGMTVEFTETRTYGCPYFITRVWTVRDDCGNETIGSQLITVQDTESPELVGVPVNITVDCESIPDTAIVTVSDNCTDDIEIIFTENISSGCPYTITRTWSATDSCNNTITGTQIITVQDTTNPVLFGVPSNVTVECTSIPDTAIVTANDNCTADIEVEFTESISAGCPYTITRTWSAIDSCNNTITASQIIEVIDTVKPILENVPSNVTVECPAVLGAALVTASDNCTQNVTIEFTEEIGTGCPYTITRKWVAIDNCLNKDSVIQVITVEDNIDPILAGVPASVTVDCGAIPDAAIVTSVDACAGVLEVDFAEEISTGCPYTITRTWSATDSCNNTVTATQVITVEDNTNPTFTNVPSNVTVSCDAIPDIANVVANDDCIANIDIVFTEEITTGCPYTITRKWVAADDCLNKDSVIQVITVEDNTAPILSGVPQAITVNCESITDTATLLANDNCSTDMTIEFSETRTFGCPYFITRVWKVEDDCGNESTVSQLITVVDTTDPELSGVPDDVTVNCESIPDTAIVTASDVCAPNIEVVFSEEISTGCPYTITRTWSATDSCNNTITDSQVITVNDTNLPTLVGVPDDVTVNCEDIPDPETITVEDGCWNGLEPVLNEVTTSGCPYTIIRTWTATDPCGNSVSDEQIITVEDEEGPEIASAPDDLILDCTDNIPPAVELTAEDNCSEDPIEDIDFSESSEGECPVIITRSWTAYDECDNETTVTQTITIIDDTAPILYNLPTNVTVDCSEIPDTQLIVATDDCDPELDLVFTETYSDTICDYNYKITRTWTFTDNCDNAVSHTQEIQVEDNIAPTFSNVPPDVVIACDSILAENPPTASDNCSDVTVVFTEVEMPGSCVDLKLAVRTWTATDACGNEFSVSQNIIYSNCGPEVTIAIAPSNVVCEGTEVTFTSSLTPGYDTPNYQWQFSEDGILWTNISGANNSTYTDITEPSSSGFYQVVVANDASDLNNPMCSISSNAQSLTVIEQTVEINEVGLEICQGDSIVVGNSTYFDTGIFSDTLQSTSGCDSAIVNLNLIVNLNYTLTVDSVICEGEFVTIGNSTYNQNGVFTNNLNSIAGCDSVVTLNLTVNPLVNTVLNETICEGETFEVGSNSYSSSGTYENTFLSSKDCDSTVTLNLLVNEKSESSLVENICPGETYVVGTSVFSTTGTYEVILPNANNCDSTITLDLTVRDEYVIDVDTSICIGETIIVGDSIYTATGNYWTVLESEYGCDSIVNLNLTVHPIFTENISDAICANETYEVGDSTYSTTGIYTTTMASENGCDSVVILDLTVHPIYSENIVEAICEGEDFEVGDSTYSATGIYTTTMESENGCDSVVILDLTVNPVFSENITDAICANETYEVGDSTYSATGIYTTTMESVGGCDSVVILDLTVHPIFTENITNAICANETYEVGDSTYSTTGIYTTTMASENGCDSVVILDLTVHPIFSENVVEAICEGEDFEVGDSTYSATGIYTTTMESENGCDSVVILDLTVNPVFSENITDAICANEVYEVGDSTYSATGIYTTTMESVGGCDSVVILDLTVHPIFSENITNAICANETYEVGDSTYSATGIYTTTMASENGCDSVVILDLTVHPIYSENVVETICEGEDFEVGDSTYSATGIYTTTMESENGCDSVVILDLTVNPVFSENITDAICANEVYEVGDSTYSATGIYTTTMESVGGCDSVVILDLTVHPIFSENITNAICANETYEVGDSTYSATGIYTTTMASENGCDSVVILDLTVHPIYSENVVETICEGEDFEVGDSTYSATGIYTTTMESENGCDSVVILDLTVNPVFSENITDAICANETYEVGDSTYSATGIYTTTMESENGCDSVVILDLTVHPIFSENITNAICANETYEVGDSTYSATGIYTTTMASENGCDSVVILDLTVHPIFSENVVEAICEGEDFEVGDSTYSATGIYTTTMESENGCDSVVILDLTVNPVFSENITDAICANETYEVGDSTYSATGIYTTTMESVDGCDSVVILNLTVHPIFSENISDAICANETYEVGDSTYSTTGIYTTIMESENGCDSVVILDLTVHPIYSENVLEAICEGEVFEVGDSTYSATGIYTTTMESENGCDSVVILDLTVNPVFSENITDAICANEVYEVGDSTYSATGIYTTTMESENGCDSVVILDLTVHPIFSENITNAICANETYEVGDSTYSTTGIYTTTMESENGCDSVVILDLTVHPIYSENVVETICEGEDFEVGDSTYSATGIYTTTMESENGCDSVVILDLTVNPVFSENITDAICANEVYEVGDSTYSATGIYTTTMESENGCDSVVILDLTVHPIFSENITNAICANETYEVGDSTYSTTGIYTTTMASENGCDSVVILDLTVHPIYSENIVEAICEGEDFILGDSTYSEGGIFIQNLISQNGCDSIYILDLTVHSIDTTYLDEFICEGQTYEVGDSSYTTSGTYTTTLEASTTCDSVVILNLVVDDVLEINLSENICQGETFELGNQTYSTTGIYTYTATASSGCDSVVTLDLVVQDTFETLIEETICQGENHEVGDSTYTTSGIYTTILTSVEGCDSTVILDLTVNETFIENLNEAICQGDIFEVGDSTYTASGTYTNILTSINGCDSTVNLTLTVNENITTNLEETICFGETFELGDSIYTTSGIFTQNHLTSTNCDSTVILDLTILGEIENNVAASICEGTNYELGDSIYTTSGTYTNILTSAAGCDSTVTLTLTVNNEITVNLEETICNGETFELGDSIYTTSGEFTQTYLTSTNCDSIVILDLTILEEIENDISASICEGTNYELGDSTYTVGGTYTNILTSINGCDSTVNLTLTVNENITTNLEETICFGETFELGDSTYTTSGIFTQTHLTSTNCDSTVILDLTILGEIENNVAASICEGTNYEQGDSTYTTSGIYTNILTSSAGCDSTVTLTLTVNNEITVNLEETICNGETFELGDSIYTTSGVFTQTYLTSTNCDSIVILDLTILEEIENDISASICEGTNYELGDSTYTVGGTYTNILTSINGCDSTVNLTLTVNENITTNLEETICFGETFELGDSTYTTSGIFTQNHLTSTNCDSTVILDLTILGEIENNVAASICEGTNYELGDSIYTTSGIYTNILTSSAGCDSTVTLTLIVNNEITVNLEETICNGETFELGDSIYTTSGVFTQTYLTSTNCDSIVILDLTILEEIENDISASICEGTNYELGDSTYTVGGTYTNVLTSVDGCDSTVNLTLTVVNEITVNLEETICFGETFELGDSTYTTSGVFTQNQPAVGGCDSTTILNLTILDEIVNDISATICENERYELGDSIYLVAGTYTNILTTSQGCDSIVNLTLAVSTSFENTVYRRICDDETYFAGGADQNATGIYTDSLISINGCDSIIITDLTVLTDLGSTLEINICEGDSYEFGNVEYTNSGTYSQTLNSVLGCDSLVQLILQVDSQIIVDLSITLCEGEAYEFGNSTLTQSGTYADTLISNFGCDSITNLELEFIPTVEETIDANICEGEEYEFGNMTYQASGIYSDTLISSTGCDSITTLNLSVNPNFEIQIFANICENESYPVGGMLYNQTGIYQDTFTSVFGCDSVIILNLNVKPILKDTLEVTICQGETYQVGNDFYSVPGTFTNTFSGSNGCDSLSILILEVSNVQPTVLYQNLCEGDSILLGGAYQTTGGVYTNILQSTNGCDSAIYTYLSMVDDVTSFAQETICEGDSIFLGGNYQFEPGEFTESYPSALGCDSFVIIELIVEPMIELYAEDLEMCEGETGQLFVEGADYVTWSPTIGLSCNHCPNPTVSVTSTTTYKVTAQSCLGTTVETSATVYINKPPELFVTENSTIIKGESLILMASTDDITDQVIWTENNGLELCDNCREVTVTPEETTTYLVTAIDENGCVSTAEIEVKVNDGCQHSKLEVPNMISPNGDGFNDYFEIRSEGFAELSLLKIYNRWGEVVFETNNIEVEWDGTFRGKPLNPGVYVYYLEGICLNEEAFFYTGNVTILK